MDFRGMKNYVGCLNDDELNELIKCAQKIQTERQIHAKNAAWTDLVNHIEKYEKQYGDLIFYDDDRQLYITFYDREARAFEMHEVEEESLV